MNKNKFIKELALTIPLAIFAISCTSSSSKCIYSSVVIKAMINDRTIDEKQVRGCFIVHETEDNIVEISLRDSSETFSMHYVKPKDSISGNPYIPHLDVKTNGSISAWTQDKGHVIYYQEKDKSLAFSFSDDTTKDNRVSGILVFQQ